MGSNVSQTVKVVLVLVNVFVLVVVQVVVVFVVDAFVAIQKLGISFGQNRVNNS